MWFCIAGTSPTRILPIFCNPGHRQPRFPPPVHTFSTDFPLRCRITVRMFSTGMQALIQEAKHARNGLLFHSARGGASSCRTPAKPYTESFCSYIPCLRGIAAHASRGALGFPLLQPMCRVFHAIPLSFPQKRSALSTGFPMGFSTGRPCCPARTRARKPRCRNPAHLL